MFKRLKQSKEPKEPKQPKLKKSEAKKKAKEVNEKQNSIRHPHVDAPKKIPPISMWMVLDEEYPDRPVTFVSTHEDAVIALDQYLYLKHYPHFRNWCELHDRQIDHSISWYLYTTTVLKKDSSGEPKYAIIRIDYQPNVIASLLRTYNQCCPLGLPFDTDEEIYNYAERCLDPTVGRSDTEKNLELLMEDIANDRLKESAQIKEHIAHLQDIKMGAGAEPHDDSGGKEKYDA